MVSRSDAKARFPTCVPVMGGQSHHLSHRSPARATDQQYQRVNRQGYRRPRLPGPRPRRWRRRAGDRARRTPRHGAPDWPSHRPGEIVARGELDMYSAPRTGRRDVCSVGRAAAAQARVGSRPSCGSPDLLAKRCWSAGQSDGDPYDRTYCAWSACARPSTRVLTLTEVLALAQCDGQTTSREP